jgi:hypothetical protein
MESQSKLEADRRRFDIGSGKSVELLDTHTLDFIFHPWVEHKILGGLAPSISNKGMDWNRGHGIGSVHNTKEILALVASSAEKIYIRKALSTHGNISSLLKIAGDPTLPSNHETLVGKLEYMINEVGRLVTLGVILRTFDPYNVNTFFELHGGENASRRMMVQGTIGTSQHKVLITSYDINTSEEIKVPSHDSVISEEECEALGDIYSEPFGDLKRDFRVNGIRRRLRQ